MIIDNWSIPGLLYTQYVGIVIGSDMVDHALQKSGDERFDNLDVIISDWTHIDKRDLFPEDIVRLVACLKAVSKICPNAKHSSIVNRRESDLSIAALYCHLGEELPWDIEIFSNVDEAFKAHKLDMSKLKDSENLRF